MRRRSLLQAHMLPSVIERSKGVPDWGMTHVSTCQVLWMSCCRLQNPRGAEGFTVQLARQAHLEQQEAVHHSILPLGQAILILCPVCAHGRHAGGAGLLGLAGPLSIPALRLLAGRLGTIFLAWSQWYT